LHRALDTAGAIVGVLIAALLLWWLSDSPLASTKDSVPQSAIDTPAWIYRTIFGIGAILGLLSWLFTLFVQEPNRTPATPLSDANHPIADHGMSEPATGSSRKRLNLPKSYWYTLVVFLVFSLANSSDAFLLLRIQELGYSPWAVVMSYALFNIVYSILSYPAGSLSDRIGRWRVIGLGWVLYAIVYAAFAWLPVSQAWGVWPLMAFYGAYMALTEGVGKALIADQAPAESRGAAMGIFYGATGLSTFLASVIAGLVWDQYGSTAALMLGTVFASLGLCFSAVIIAIQGKRSD
jgi:MFS family permease